MSRPLSSSPAGGLPTLLLTNDDGPPASDSPFVLPLLAAIDEFNARAALTADPSLSSSAASPSLVSSLRERRFVCVPRHQQSWISKAHQVRNVVSTSYYRCSDEAITADHPAASANDGEAANKRPRTGHHVIDPANTTSTLSTMADHISTDIADAPEAGGNGRPLADEAAAAAAAASNQVTEGTVMTLLDAPPATCVNIALFHMLKDKDIDLVISGPNFGRNSASIFTLASGTIGGAMEAALCGKRAIAISFAMYKEVGYTERDVVEACRASVDLIHRLWHNWPAGVDLFNINVPVFPGVDAATLPVHRTSILRNQYGSLFAQANQDGDDAAPQYRFTSQVTRLLSTEASDGTDAWALARKEISVTPLAAAFEHARMDDDAWRSMFKSRA